MSDSTPTLPAALPGAYPPEMLVALAANLAPELDVAARYGYSASEFRKLRETAPFQAALKQAKDMVQEHGYDADMVDYTTIQTMTGKVTAQLFEMFYMRNISADTKVKIAQALYQREERMRGRVKSEKANPNGGGGFSITINIPPNQTPSGAYQPAIPHGVTGLVLDAE